MAKGWDLRIEIIGDADLRPPRPLKPDFSRLAKWGILLLLARTTYMTSLRHYPLGQRVPNSPHAVVSSIPTMTDVRDYEEKDPRVVAAMLSGYPRFVVHSYIRELIAFYLDREALAGRAGVLIPSRRAADDLSTYVDGAVQRVEVEHGLYLVHADGSDADLNLKIRKFVQHTGCGISSRQAEDLLFQLGRLEARHVEASFEGAAGVEVERQLSELCGCRPDDVLVCASGMNAFYSAFRAVQELQRSRGRTRWLQLGWLYVDSGCILEKFLGESESLDCCYDVEDTDALIEKIESAGDLLAAVVLECPTNPLVQVCDLARVAAAVRKAGGVLIVDPTMASIYNVDVLPHADILVNSLTKYASHEGDVMIGALAVNPASPFYGDLILRTSAFYVAPYFRDLARLAFEMQRAPETVARINENAARLVAYFSGHPAVAKVFYPTKSAAFPVIAKGEPSGGAVVSIVLRGSMERFYDAVAALKGPSFGTGFTLLAPFIYLSHYDLVTTEEGCALLAKAGIDPELIRISVGSEPYESIEAVFADALRASDN